MANASRPQNEPRFATETGLAGEVTRIAEPVLEELGYRLVRVQVSGRNGATVQVMAERPDGTITIEDCAVISRNLSPALDAYDPLPGQYHLEVSSPGIDRPLVRPGDFVHWAGFETRIELKQELDGRKRYRGRILGLEAGEIRIEAEIEPGLPLRLIGLPVGLVSTARLVMTDELLRETLRRRAKAGETAQDDPAAEGMELDVGLEESDGAGRRERKPAGAAPDRRRGRTGKID